MLRGREEPRLLTQPLRELTPETSLGYEAIRFAEQMLGVDLMPWQKFWLIHALELDAEGNFRFRTIVTLVARQSGKTHLLKVLILFMMYTGRVRMVLGAAQSLAIARESWEGAVDFAQDDPELRSEVAAVQRANGEQTLKLVNGARYKISASNRSAGRGLSVDLLVLDELREHRDWLAWGALSKTTIARPNALTIAISNAGDDQSEVLNSLRESAVAGNDPTLALLEWSAPDGCALDDREAWAQANPALGHYISERAIESALSTDTPEVFRTEVLCQRVDTLDSALDAAAWKGCADPSGALDVSKSRVALCLDVSPDMGHISLSAAAMLPDGRVRVELLDTWHSTEDARHGLPGWITKIKPKKFGWFPGGPSAGLATDLRAIKRSVELKAGDVPAVCQEFAEQITARRLLHSNDARLAAQVAGASRLPSGDGFRFTRKGVGHVEAVYAAAGAVHLARTMPARAAGPLIVVPRTRAS